MTSPPRGEGGSGKADKVREVALILWYKPVAQCGRGGEGVKKSKNSADDMNG